LVNTSISRIVQTLIDNDLSLQEALRKDYGNYSAIARMLKPDVEKILGRKVKLESIITSVKRAKTSFKGTHENIAKVIAKSKLNIVTDVAKISVEKTRRNKEIVRKNLANFSEEFFQIIEGASAITLIFDEKLFEDVCSKFPIREVLDKRRNLAAIFIRSPPEIIDTPGCAIAFYNVVSRAHINIEETLSCFTDTIIVLKMEDVNKAFSVLMDLITENRRKISVEDRDRSPL